MKMLDDKVLSLPRARRAVGACCAFGVLGALAVTGQAVSLAIAVSALWSGAALASQAAWIVLFFCCFAARQVGVFARDAHMDRFAHEACTWLREEATARLFDLGPEYVARAGSGAVTTTLVEGLDQVRDYLGLILPKVADLMVVPTVLGIALLLLDPLSGIICILLVPVTIFFMRLLGSYAQENAARQFGAYRRMANQFADTLAGIATLKYFGAGKRQGERVFATSERLREATVKTLRTATLSSLVLDLIRVFALAAVAIMLGFRLMAGEVALMPALAVLVIVPEFFAAIRRYASDFHASLDGRSQLAAVLAIIEAPVKHEEVPYPRRPGEGATGTVKLELRDVSFAYAEEGASADGPMPAKGPAATSEFALENISFTASGPLKVGIVGTSGSGKSTLARLLAGFSSPSAGKVAIDGVMGSTLATPAWRERVAYLPQDPHLFSASLRDNVRFYEPQADDAAVLGALQGAGLGALPAEMPEGLDAPIGPGGRLLSGGQAQRVALARVLVAGGRDVLVFDEPTAHLDIETEAGLKRDMLPLMEDRLVFFATHRLHWMHEMDLVLVLENGRLAECGAPDELLARGGAFAELVGNLRGGSA